VYFHSEIDLPKLSEFIILKYRYPPGWSANGKEGEGEICKSLVNDEVLQDKFPVGQAPFTQIGSIYI